MEQQNLMNIGFFIILIIHTVVLFSVIYIKQNRISINTASLVFKLYKIIPVVVFIAIVLAVIMMVVATIQNPSIWDALN